MHPNFPMTIAQLTDRKRVVKVFGFERVDGESGDMAKIFAIAVFLRLDFFGKCRSFFFGFGGISFRQFEFTHNVVAQTFAFFA